MKFYKYLLYAALLLAVVACKPRETLVPEPIEEEITEQEQESQTPDIKTRAPELAKLTPVRYYRNLAVDEVSYQSSLRFDGWRPAIQGRPDLGRILPEGADIYVIAVGGGLTAGVQNGGLYREGQLAAYPNLVARQLGMTNFTTPAFSENEANGTGFQLLVDDNASFPSFLEVTNNLAKFASEADGYPPSFNRFNGEVHNFAAPWTDGIPADTWEPWMVGRVSVGTSGYSWPRYYPYVKRLIPEEASHLTEYISNHHSYNFFLLEDQHERFVNLLRDKYRRPLSLSDLIGDIQAGTPIARGSMRGLSAGGRKGVVFTIPQIEHLAYDYWESGLLWTGNERMIYRNAVNIYNDRIKTWASEYDLAVVDIEAIYQKIQDGGYTTEDGIVIDGSPRGNFFSSDGIYPTVLGQAVIANEVLKAINATYQAKVPLVPIRAYAEGIGLTLK